MHATETTQTQQVNLLACWDQKNIMWSSEWVLDPPNTTALNCVDKIIPDAHDAVVSCGSGSLGEDLKTEAADYFHATFPEYWTGNRFSVPHIYIDNKEQDINLDGTDFWEFTESICTAGANAGLCEALPQNGVKV